MLNEELLEKAVRILRVKTYSEAVNVALSESIQLHQLRGMASLMGQTEWDGDLSEMREDSPKKKLKPSKKAK